MPNIFQYDVFLSHNQADKPRVRRLAERLTLQLGTRNSELGIAQLCLSPAALGSDWVGLACPAGAPEQRRKRSTGLFRQSTLSRWAPNWGIPLTLNGSPRAGL